MDDVTCEYRLMYLTDCAQMTRLGQEGWAVVPGIITTGASMEQVLMERRVKSTGRFCAHCSTQMSPLCDNCVQRLKTEP